jgi:outer membrane protein OmpA-like peptidoglycan-associated protein
MKKTILFILASIMTFAVSAQELERSKFFDNTFIGLNFGFGQNLKTTDNPNLGFTNDKSSLVISANVGKWVTPYFGGEFTYSYGVDAHEYLGNSSFLGANFLFNMNNIIAGYKGEPRVLEVIPFIGTGWYRTHDVVTNNIAARAGLKFAVNLNESFQLNVNPTINYLLTDDGISTYPTPQPRFDIRRSWVTVQVGIVYKFKTSNGTHNFKYSDKLYTQEQMDVYVNDVDKLMEEVNRLREASEKSKNENDTLSKQVEDLNKQLKELSNKNIELCNHNITNVIGFEIGKEEIMDTNRSTILNILNTLKENENSKVVLTGYSDKQTGSAKRNMKLSIARAEAVKNVLIKLGVKEERIEVKGMGDTVQPFNENDANRVVISLINY